MWHKLLSPALVLTLTVLGWLSIHCRPAWSDDTRRQPVDDIAMQSTDADIDDNIAWLICRMWKVYSPVSEAGSQNSRIVAVHLYRSILKQFPAYLFQATAKSYTCFADNPAAASLEASGEPQIACDVLMNLAYGNSYDDLKQDTTWFVSLFKVYKDKLDQVPGDESAEAHSSVAIAREALAKVVGLDSMQDIDRILKGVPSDDTSGLIHKTLLGTTWRVTSRNQKILKFETKHSFAYCDCNYPNRVFHGKWFAHGSEIELVYGCDSCKPIDDYAVYRGSLARGTKDMQGTARALHGAKPWTWQAVRDNAAASSLGKWCKARLVVATRNISVGTSITRQDVEVTPLEIPSLPNGAYKDANACTVRYSR
jgi:hypothetical protein